MDDLALLRLFQLFDAQFPTGSFAHSAGLETYAHLGAGPAELRELLTNQLELGSGRLDLAAVRMAWERAEAPDSLEALAQRVEAWKVIPSLRRASLGLGRRTLSLARRLFPDAAATLQIAYPHQSVVIGVLGRRLGIRPRPLLLGFGQAALSASLAAATRCMPLSPGQAQELLVELQPALARVVDEVMEDPRSWVLCRDAGVGHPRASVGLPRHAAVPIVNVR